MLAHKKTARNESGWLIQMAGTPQGDGEKRGAARDGIAGRLVRAFQLGNVGDAEKRKLSKRRKALCRIDKDSLMESHEGAEMHSKALRRVKNSAFSEDM